MVSFQDWDITFGQKTIDKYDPKIKREKQRALERKVREDAFKIERLEAEADDFRRELAKYDLTGKELR